MQFGELAYIRFRMRFFLFSFHSFLSTHFLPISFFLNPFEAPSLSVQKLSGRSSLHRAHFTYRRLYHSGNRVCLFDRWSFNLYVHLLTPALSPSSQSIFSQWTTWTCRWVSLLFVPSLSQSIIIFPFVVVARYVSDCLCTNDISTLLLFSKYFFWLLWTILSLHLKSFPTIRLHYFDNVFAMPFFHTIALLWAMRLHYRKIPLLVFVGQGYGNRIAGSPRNHEQKERARLFANTTITRETIRSHYYWVFLSPSPPTPVIFRCREPFSSFSVPFPSHQPRAKIHRWWI